MINDESKGRVLLVEDNRVNQIIFKKQLESLGLNVTVAEHGGKALEALAGPLLFDVIFMDMQMPVMDGVQCTESIRASEDNAISALPIIAITANVTDKARASCKKCGMNGFLGKPLNKKELLDQLSKYHPLF